MGDTGVQGSSSGGTGISRRFGGAVGSVEVVAAMRGLIAGGPRDRV